MSPRAIAFYLPQFHTTPENDEWWGKGYTEWTAATLATPLFNGHYQPHIPADLGFYDLRVPETRIAQADLAKEYGISGFCYYHYWFGGKRLLEQPFNEVLNSDEPKFGFCLCWANHDWTAAWHQKAKHILMKQPYPGMEDHRTHFYELLKAFTDDRYITVEGKPLFVIYHSQAIPGVRAVTDFWRELAIKEGLAGLYIVGVHQLAGWSPSDYGLDGAIMDRLPSIKTSAMNNSWGRKVFSLLQKKKSPIIHSYESVSEKLILKDKPPFQSFPCIIPNWDNTPRYGANGIVLHNSTPELFKGQIKSAIQYVSSEPTERQLIFIKAWNEWGEGNHLEPDIKFGKAYLEVIKQALESE